MSIATSDLVLYSAANVPEDDTSTSGGAIDLASRPSLTQLTTTTTLTVVSDGADVRTLAVTGRDATGAIVTENIVLTNAVNKVGTQSFERILKMVLSAGDAGRTVTVTQTTGGSTVAVLLPNATKVHAQFQRAQSESGGTTRYEKNFWRNNHATLTLTDAKVTLTADPSAKITIALAGTKSDSGSVANRKTSPGLTFSDDNVQLNVPGNQLEAGAAIGVWVCMTLSANDPAAKSSYTVQIGGTTT